MRAIHRDDRAGDERAMTDAETTKRILTAVDLALAGDWDGAHGIVQQHEGVRDADWVHAVLHKIEGDEGNARYWYRRAGRFFESFDDPQAELAAIKAALAY
jgi:hypothetical protein